MKRGLLRLVQPRFDRARDKYVGGVRGVAPARAASSRLCSGDRGRGWLFVHLPTSFLPNEDQDIFSFRCRRRPAQRRSAPESRSTTVSNYLLKEESSNGRRHVRREREQFRRRGQNQGQIFVQLKDWSQRTSNDLSVQALTGRISQRFRSYKDAAITPVNPPPIRGLGNLSASTSSSRTAAASPRQAHAGAQPAAPDGGAGPGPRAGARQRPGRQPTFKINVDREKAAALGVALTDVDQTSRSPGARASQQLPR